MKRWLQNLKTNLEEMKSEIILRDARMLTESPGWEVTPAGQEFSHETEMMRDLIDDLEDDISRVEFELEID